MAVESGSGGDKTKLYLHVSNYENFDDRPNRHEVVTPKYKDGYRNWFLVTDDDIASSSSDVRDAARGEGRILSPIQRMFVEFPSFTTSVVYVDSTVYVLGGLYFWDGMLYCRDLWYIDTAADDDDSSGGWIRGPQMLSRRLKPCVVVVDRKIYVFGGKQKHRPDDQLTWAEVFDTQSKEWSKLQVPEEITKMKLTWGMALNLDVGVEVEGYKMNKFMLLYHNVGAFLYYDFIQDKWGMFHEDFGNFVPWQLVLSRVGTNTNNMFVFAVTTSFSNGSFSEYTLHGYDLRVRSWFPVRGILDGEHVAPRPSHFEDKCFPRLHIISRDHGRLCVLWASPLNYPGPLCVRLTEFMVTLDNDSSVLLAKANPTRFLMLDDAADLIDCLTIVCYHERKRGGESFSLEVGDEEEVNKKQRMDVN